MLSDFEVEPGAKPLALVYRRDEERQPATHD